MSQYTGQDAHVQREAALTAVWQAESEERFASEASSGRAEKSTPCSTRVWVTLKLAGSSVWLLAPTARVVAESRVRRSAIGSDYDYPDWYVYVKGTDNGRITR